MLRRAIIPALLVAHLGCSMRAQAGEAVDFATVVQSAMASLRTSASYARTGNTALAQIELDDAKSAWGQLLGRFADQPPAPYSPPAFHGLLATGQRHLAQADDALGAGDGSRAGAEILALRRSIHDLRHQAGLFELNDCVFELAATMENLRAVAVSFGTTKTGADTVKDAGNALRDRLQRCNGLASPEIASQAEFRRLIDGAIASAGEIGRAALDGDAALMHRYQIELQSFVNLLDFRFG